jgi:hypothetical protein
MIRQTWSVNRLATELQLDRRALAKRLEGLKPATEKKTARGIDREWFLSAVVEHLYRPTDGERLDPQQERARLDKLRADQVADAIAIKRRDLIPASEYADALTRALKPVAIGLESLPETLERDCHLDGATVERIIGVLDRIREDMYRGICASADEHERD